MNAKNIQAKAKKVLWEGGLMETFGKILTAACFIAAIIGGLTCLVIL